MQSQEAVRKGSLFELPVVSIAKQTAAAALKKKTRLNTDRRTGQMLAPRNALTDRNRGHIIVEPIIRSRRPSFTALL
jgi:hypothetical protein